MKRRNRTVCGLDTGAWKTSLVMARVYANGVVEVLASGFAKSGGLIKGAVVDIAEVSKSVGRAVEEAESRSSISVNRVVTGISGVHIKGYNFRGAVQIQGKHGEVTIKDIQNAIYAAKSIPLPPDSEIIHLLPQEFFLNNHGGIKNPLGLVGSQLDVTLYVITGAGAQIQSLINAANKAQIEVKKVILQAIASGVAVLTPEEKDLGTAVIDIGAGITGIAVFSKNSVGFVSVIPVGGEHFTRDLVEALRISREEAERIKVKHGNVLPELVVPDEMTVIQGLGLRGEYELARRHICEYLHDRGAELLEIIKDELRRSSMNLIGGAVLTGGGSLMGGIIELAERILEMPVRRGIPGGCEGLTNDLMHPSYACAVGLVIMDAQESLLQDLQNRLPSKPSLTDKMMWSCFGK